MNKLLEIKRKGICGTVTEYQIKDGRKIVAKVSHSNARRPEERFLVQMNGCAFYKATSTEVTEFVRSTIQDRMNAFGGDSKVMVRGFFSA